LLEIVVVVAILGLAAALSAPSVGRMVARQQAQEAVRSVSTELAALRVEAYLAAASIDAETTRARLDAVLPERWEVSVEPGLRFSASGYCAPGVVTVFEPSGRAWRLQVAEGDCTVSRADS
jgi:type II secretory pathway pseudopilin PulG